MKNLWRVDNVLMREEAWGTDTVGIYNVTETLIKNIHV